MVRLLEVHFRSVNTCSHSSQGCSARTQARQPEAVAPVSDDDWQYFLFRWDCYKKMTVLKGKDIELELMECCSEPLRRDHHTHFASKRASVSEAKVLKEIQQLSVMAKNKTVNRAKLH